MDNQKIHIDKYFQEKVKTQEVEGEIPSFDEFILANPQSKKVGSTNSSWLNVAFVVGFFTIVSVAVYYLFWNKSETIIQKPEFELPIEVEPIKKQIRTVKIENAVKQTPVEILPKKTVRDRDTKIVESKELVKEKELVPTIEIQEVIEIPKKEELKIESPIIIETPVIVKEEPKNFDLDFEKNKPVEVKGVKRYIK